MQRKVSAILSVIAIGLAVIAVFMIVGAFSLARSVRNQPQSTPQTVFEELAALDLSPSDDQGDDVPVEEQSDPGAAPSTTTGPFGVPFPSGSIDHAFFPLTGAHSIIACESCHTGLVYAGAPTDCTSCHLDQKPLGHFEGDCALCHDPADWLLVHFDHAAAGATDCKLCHTDQAPVNHYSGQCSACHSTAGWLPADFDHSGQTSCTSCHLDDKPANHFDGQCSACHSTSTWAGAVFDHSGQTSCTSCHLDDKPANHFDGQCSACHSTSSWENASFNHAGQTNCSSCHTPPSNHYAGQCSACHDTNNWDFEHANGLDCMACHLDDLPDDDDHPPAEQCSNCHNTDDWDDVDDDDGVIDVLIRLLGWRSQDHTAGSSGTANGLDRLAVCSSCHIE